MSDPNECRSGPGSRGEAQNIIEAPLADGAVAFQLRCHAGQDAWDVPEWAVLTITPQRARGLFQLCETVRALGVHKITDFDYSPDFYAWGEDDNGNETPGEPVRTEIDQVCCYADGVRWSAAVRHTDWTFSTEEVPVSRLLEIAEHGLGNRSPSPPRLIGKSASADPTGTPPCWSLSLPLQETQPTTPFRDFARRHRAMR
jgi:hypothetical protein